MNKITKLVTSIMGVSLSHWGLVRIYTYICQPSGLWGMLASPLLLGSPMCMAIWNTADTLRNHFTTIISGITIIGLLK